jgi:hypothetical protein
MSLYCHEKHVRKQNTCNIKTSLLCMGLYLLLHCRKVGITELNSTENQLSIHPHIDPLLFLLTLFSTCIQVTLSTIHLTQVCWWPYAISQYGKNKSGLVQWSAHAQCIFKYLYSQQFDSCESFCRKPLDSADAFKHFPEGYLWG